MQGINRIELHVDDIATIDIDGIKRELKRQFPQVEVRVKSKKPRAPSPEYELVKGKVLDYDEMKRVLNYDPATGVFTWKRDFSKRIHAGKEAGAVNPRKPNRRRTITYRDVHYSCYRLAHLWMKKEMPKGKARYLNGDKHDLRWENLAW